MKRISSAVALVTLVLSISACSMSASKTVEISLGDIPYSWVVDKSIASHVSVEVPTNDFAKLAAADGSQAQALVYYTPEKGSKSIFMAVYYFPKQSFEVASRPDEPPSYGTKVIESNGMILSAAGPQDSMYDPKSSDGKNVTALYANVYNAKSYLQNSKKGSIEPKVPPSILGCYVAKIKEDVFTLNIATQKKTNVEAFIAYKNAYKDSSHGTFAGSFDGTILMGIYTFESEGTTSRSEVIFKRSADGFKEGFGPSDMKGDLSSFTRPLTITWNDSFTFQPSTECAA